MHARTIILNTRVDSIISCNNYILAHHTCEFLEATKMSTTDSSPNATDFYAA